MTLSASTKLYIEQDGNQFNDLWLACAVIFGVCLGFFLGVLILFIFRRNFPAKYTKADAARMAESGLQQDSHEDALPKDEDTYSEIVPPGVVDEPILTAHSRKPLSWVRRQSTVDLGQEEVADGVIDALSQDTSVQMQLSLVSQEFRNLVLWEDDLQLQYRTLFLNLINIHLDGLVQQKIVTPEMKQTLSIEYDQTLKSKEREWKDRLITCILDYQRDVGDPINSNQIEEFRYEAAMALESTMLEIREQLRKDLTVKTQLKPEELEFMEEKLVENLTGLCEIINTEYESISRAQDGRSNIAKKVGIYSFSQNLYEIEEEKEIVDSFTALVNDLKSTKLSGSSASKICKTFTERIHAANMKWDEDYNQNLQEQINRCAVDRVQQMKRIKTWKRSTEIASTANQSYQAAVDGLIEPSRYVTTMHELQKTVRLDKMLAMKRIDTKEGELFENLVKQRSDNKLKEYLDILTDAIGSLKLEKNMDESDLNRRSKRLQDDMANHKARRMPELKEFVGKSIDGMVAVKEKLDKEIRRQSADQEELLGEQEDAVKEVLMTQSGLTELDREQMMAVHQHQSLAVINMLFMNRLRSVKKIETRMLQDKDEFENFEEELRKEMTAAIGNTSSKPLNKKQQKIKDAMEKKHVDMKLEKSKDMILSTDDAIGALRLNVYNLTTCTLKRFDERMGELLAKLQVSHARKEGTKIKSTQVLNKIKTKLVDMIWQDGYIPEASCKKTLQEHHKIVQDVSDKFAQKRESNSSQILKVSAEKRQKVDAQLKEEINELIEKYKAEEQSKYEYTSPLWDNWSQSRYQIEKHHSNMLETRQVQDLYNNIEDDFANELYDEEINIILELVKMGRLDVNEFDKIIKTSVTASVGGDKLYQELSKPLLEKYGQSVKQKDKAILFWDVATDQLAPMKTDPKLSAKRATNVWRSRLGIYDDKKH